MQDILEIKPMIADIDDNSFITEFTDKIDIHNAPDWKIQGNENWEYAAAALSLKWQLYIEYRSYGIKDISAYSLQAQVIIYDYNEEEIIKIDTHTMDDWTIEDSGLDIRNNIHPKYSQIDIKNKCIHIEW